MRLKTVYILLIFAALFSSLYPQKSVKMSASAVDIFKTDAFDIEITLENFDSDVSIQYPDFKDLVKISGPYQSSRTSIINGAATKSITLTYRFSPKITGVITVEPAVVKEGGKEYRSQELRITVHEEGQNAGARSRDMFILSKVSSNDVYVGEMVRIDYTLYIKPEIKLSIPSIASEPKFTNFLKERIDIPNDELRTLVQTIRNGVKYNTLPVASYWISPTSAGERNIESLTVIVPVEVRTKRRNTSNFFNDPFFDDDLFSTFRNYSEKTVLSEDIKINVKPLPDEGKPADFTGTVGTFKINSYLDNDSVSVNEAVNFKITVSGTGNLNDINELKPEFPADLEVYDPKRTVILEPDKKNSGKVIFEYLLLPRNPGKHKINDISFSYFDIGSKKYKTVSAAGRIITATGSDTNGFVTARNSGSARRNIEVLASDIRYIKKDPGDIYPVTHKYFEPLKFTISILSAFSLILISFILSVYVLKNRGNTAAARRRKAAKNAKKRLKKCYSSLDSGDITQYYKDLDEALLKFIADKLNISHAGIITDEVSEALRMENVEDDIIINMEELLSKSASIQFAPSKPGSEEMKNDLEKAKDLMTKLNERLK
ncbi:MAG: protein BatD [Candidatus Delongbacteria bacterium]|nr:protein BatD [Candidatus Delongbacteria bacterium]